jgi:ATP synthase protein I
VIDSARHNRVSAGLQDSLDSHPETVSLHDSVPQDTDPGHPAAGVEASVLTSDAPEAKASNGMDDYARLRQRLILATLLVSAVAVVITSLRFDLATAGSLLVGAMAGLLYLRLLARSVERVGNGSKSVGKFQLLVPVVLVLAAARLPELQLLPALIGFLLYKPAILLNAVFDS